MWKRSDLKRKAKISLKLNYLKCMLAGILLLFAAGSQSPGGSSTSAVQDASDAYYESMALMELAQNTDSQELADESGELTPAAYEALTERAEELAQNPTLRMIRSFVMGPMQVIWDAISNLLGGSGSFLMILLGFLVLEPITVGGCRFFLENARNDGQSKMGSLVFAFKDRSYMNIVLNLLWRNIQVILWSFLFVIPGIIKSYEYRMVPYLLAEHPEMKGRDVLRQSKELMRGQKWKTFLLDWSFILWDYLSIMTFGLAGIFFVYPYEHATNAELYLRLKKDQSWETCGYQSWEH